MSRRWKYGWIAALGIGAISVAAWYVQRDGAANPAASKADAAAGANRGGGPSGPAGAGGAGGPGGRGGPASVEVATPTVQAMREQVNAVGTLRSLQSVMLSPEASGKVLTIGFKDGQTVRKGQLMFQLEDAVQRASLSQARAQLSVAQSTHARNQELVAQGFISKAALEQSAAALQVAQAQVSTANAALSRYRVLAPFSGRVGIAKVSSGAYVREGAELVTLDDSSQMAVDFLLPERYQTQVRIGQMVQVRTDEANGGVAQPADASAGANADAKRNPQTGGSSSTAQGIVSAKVTAIEPAVQEASRALMVRATLQNPNPNWRAGAFMRASLVLAEQDNAMVIPEEAVALQQGQSTVWLLQEDGTNDEGKPKFVAKRQPVQLGLRSNGKVQVLQGLGPQDRIVVAGQQRLQRDASPVRVVQAPGQGQQGDGKKPAASTSAGGQPALAPQ